MLNQQIQNYKILSLLGQGGMATVHLAYDSKFDTNVAIKLLIKEYTHNENIRKRFLAEAKSMFKMSHPNIVKVTDLIDDGETVAFVMEYVEGETLKEYIERKGKLSDDEIKSIFSQMLDAVGYVHEQNLVHRDIKPSNFMVSPKGIVKLMDFGIAKNTDASSAEYTQTGTGVQMGTPMYMSPEQIKSTKEVTFASDIYSLGVVLWQMVTGEKPYDLKTLSSFDLLTKIVTEKLPITNTFWDGIIDKATRKVVGNRFLDCAGFSDGIKGISNKETIKPEQDSFEHTVIEQSKPKEKELSNPKIEEEIKETTLPISENNPPKKRKWVIPVSISVLGLILLLFYFGNDNKVELSDKVIDIDGNNYSIDTIGKQTWMKENLNVSKFRNGDLIPEAKTAEEWKKAGDNGEPAWCYYENNAANGKKYGKLYNWYAVIDARGLAPEGYHVPSDKEWSTLINFLGGKDNACQKMKSVKGWSENMIGDGNGTNESGFDGLPGGCRYGFGDYDGSVGYDGNWWSSTSIEDELDVSSWGRTLSNEYEVRRLENDKSNGLSVRCLRD